GRGAARYRPAGAGRCARRALGRAAGRSPLPARRPLGSGHRARGARDPAVIRQPPRGLPVMAGTIDSPAALPLRWNVTVFLEIGHPMSKLLPLAIACAEYDRTRAIKDGRVRVDGCEVTYLPLDPEELFFRAFRYHDFDVAELSFNSYLMTTSRGVCPYVAVPAFVSRHFRHSSVFIRTDRGIRGPAGLKGKLVGLPEYQQTANVWMRGIFKEEYGLDPADISWRTGGQEEPGRDERTPLKLPGNVDVQAIPPGKTLNKMLVDGELDAVLSARELS